MYAGNPNRDAAHDINNERHGLCGRLGKGHQNGTSTKGTETGGNKGNGAENSVTSVSSAVSNSVGLGNDPSEDFVC